MSRKVLLFLISKFVWNPDKFFFFNQKRNLLCSRESCCTHRLLSFYRLVVQTSVLSVRVLRSFNLLLYGRRRCGTTVPRKQFLI